MSDSLNSQFLEFRAEMNTKMDGVQTALSTLAAKLDNGISSEIVSHRKDIEVQKEDIAELKTCVDRLSGRGWDLVQKVLFVLIGAAVTIAAKSLVLS